MSVASIVDTIASSVTYPIPNDQYAPTRGALIVILHLISIRTPKFLDDLCCNSEDRRFITGILFFTVHKQITFPLAYQYLAGYLGVHSIVQMTTPAQVFDFIAARHAAVGLRQRSCNNCTCRFEDREFTSIIEHVQCPPVTNVLQTDVDIYNSCVDNRLVTSDCGACGAGVAIERSAFYSPPPAIGMSVTFPVAPCTFYLSGIIERGIGVSIHRWALFAEIWRNAEFYSVIVHPQPGPDMVHPTERMIGTRVPDDNLVLELLYHRVF